MATKKTGTKMTVWQQQMQDAAKKQIAHDRTVGAGYKSINTQGGVLSIDDVPCKNNELRLIFLMGIKENQYFEDVYRAGEKAIPACYAFATEDEDEDSMAPHEECKAAQSEACDGCPMNEWGSADTGRGKACKNIYRLACVTEADVASVEAFEAAEIRTLKVPVTSVKGWIAHKKRIAEDMNLPTWGVVTLLKEVVDRDTQFKLMFGFEEEVQLDQALVTAILAKVEALSTEMTQPYQEPIEETKPRRGAKAKPAARGKVTISKAPPRSRNAKPVARKRKF
jgi:hypothetical protein